MKAIKKTVLTLKSADHEALSEAASKIFTKTNRTARLTVNKVLKKENSRIYGVTISFDLIDKDLIEILEKIDFTRNVSASFRDII